MELVGKASLKNIGNALKNAASDVLSNTDFLSRSIGMSNSYDSIMMLIQSMGREPVSLLGKDYLFIYDHVRRNVIAGTSESSMAFEFCNKFTFYKERPTIRFADPYYDSMNLLSRWVADMDFNTTVDGRTLRTYAESDDDTTNNKTTRAFDANLGVNYGGVYSYASVNTTCDLIAKTNANFNHGKYRTLISRFHTNSQDSKDLNDPTQTAITKRYGMSHGRNLLKLKPDESQGYDNPYCRVWTNHHQYHRLADVIRPFCDADNHQKLEERERVGDYDTVGFRTKGVTQPKKFDGGSIRLDKYGTLNRNGMVNIAPTAKIVDYFNDSADDYTKVSIKKCMFSIENLAWKTDNIIKSEYDQWGLSPEQKGPLGGRIMWFPPYDLSFSEDVSVNWNPNQFIGRGEKIYTYTDTERRGNLSFMLLIDHPSVLDYWTGHKKNGMKNNGLYLKPGNTDIGGSGVDELLNQENTLLRFFAGCDVLTAQPQEYLYKDRKPNKVDDVEEEPPVKEDPVEPEVTPPKTKKVIHCVLYYPNNYSGVDDGSGVVNPIHYLMNGVGAQKYVNENNDTADIPTTIENEIKVHSKILPNGVSNNVINKKGGYEVGKNNGCGVSVANSNLETNYGAIKSSFSDLESNERKAQYLTSENGTIAYQASYGGDERFTLAKIVGSEAMPLSSAKVESNLTKKPHEWYRRRWYYRIDKAYENQRLSTKNSYLDVNDFGLNGKTGYQNVKGKTEIAKAFGLDSVDENTILISFADMFVALEGANARRIMNGCFDDNNVKIVEAIMNDKETYNVTSVKFEGHASYQGYATSNDTLSTNRALTFKKWMQKMGFPNVDNAEYGTKKQDPNNNVDKGENSDLTVKMWRSASVIIEYEQSAIEDASMAESERVGDKTDSASKAPLNDLVKTSIPNGKDSMAPINISSYANYSITNWEKEFQNNTDKVMSEFGIKIKKAYGQDSYQEEMAYDEKYGSGSKKDNDLGDGVHKGVVERYDNEGEFFELLEKNDPFLHHLITDKIRYFDPAFHSISPEGFNARLTFLHQCTRQGPTVGSSDNIANTAYNLAFGRPPVCVLRLGDFYYTKIIMNSVSIQYENAQWDLNPEGIGVMPMFAKVTIGFTFLGGSDLAGPISRLQNAVSFNYYANTGVYDNRAEMVQYDPDGSGKEIAFKPYSYPNMLHSDGLPQEATASISTGPFGIDDVYGPYDSKMIGKAAYGEMKLK